MAMRSGETNNSRNSPERSSSQARSLSSGVLLELSVAAATPTARICWA